MRTLASDAGGHAVALAHARSPADGHRLRAAPGGPFERCSVELPRFNFEINEAIAEVENEVPELFDFNDAQGGLSYRVTDRARYHAEVVERLEKKGFCAVWDGEEVGVKNTNAFDEQYQVMTSLGYVRWGAGAYRSTCFPSWF